MNPQESRNPQTYPAGQVEPGWQLYINEQWQVAGVVIETETPDGTRYVTIAFEDPKLPAVKLRKEATVTARPPDLPASPPPVA